MTASVTRTREPPGRRPGSRSGCVTNASHRGRTRRRDHRRSRARDLLEEEHAVPSITGRSAINAGASVTNVFLGSQYELAPFDCTIEVGCLCDKNLVTMNLFSGSDVLAEPGSAVPVGTIEFFPK